MDEFIKWLRVELLRLRSLDWGNGTKSMTSLKDGVLKFNSYYSISSLTQKTGLSEDELLNAIGSPQVVRELEEKAFTVHWKEGTIVLAWLEEGIAEWKMDITLNYIEKDSNFFQQSRSQDRIVYLDGTERIVCDSGERPPVAISKAMFDAAKKQIIQSNAKQKALPPPEHQQ
jgi:hypothetical protein